MCRSCASAHSRAVIAAIRGMSPETLPRLRPKYSLCLVLLAWYRMSGAAARSAASTIHGATKSERTAAKTRSAAWERVHLDARSRSASDSAAGTHDVAAPGDTCTARDLWDLSGTLACLFIMGLSRAFHGDPHHGPKPYFTHRILPTAASRSQRTEGMTAAKVCYAEHISGRGPAPDASVTVLAPLDARPGVRGPGRRGAGMRRSRPRRRPGRERW